MLLASSILEAREFEWESQLRFYWEKESDQLVVQQCTGTFGFGYEYMGLNGRLVITSLTDRIYLTITQALSMHLGGAPAGPAGTGKTETVKDLAKAMGLLCVVTNCGEGMDYKASPTINNIMLFESSRAGCSVTIYVCEDPIVEECLGCMTNCLIGTCKLDALHIHIVSSDRRKMHV